MTEYKVIIADPPWQYGSPRAMPGCLKKNGKFSSVDVTQHYSTMSVDDICAMQIPAADDALLFMWVTNPFLCDGSGPRVVRAWGFEPKTILTWAKVQTDQKTPSMKTGHWFRSASEHVIFGVRGKFKRPPEWPATPTWFPHKRLPHSVKPDSIHDFAERACPDGPWLELFARRRRPGWAAIGDQLPPSVDDEFAWLSAK